MTVTLFITLLVILSVAVSLFTEAVKKFLADTDVKYSSNVVVLILSIIVGAGGTAVAYMYLDIAYTVPNVMCAVLMAVAVWVGAMVGYDKVLQMIEQVKSLRLK